MLAIGDLIIETPCLQRSRYFEVNNYKEILQDYMLSGARWIAAPKLCLKDESYNTDQHQVLKAIFKVRNLGHLRPSC